METDILVTHMPPKFHLDIDGRGEDWIAYGAT